MPTRLRIRNPTAQDIFNSFHGRKSNIIAQHIQKNIDTYKTLSPEDVKSKVLTVLRQTNSEVTEANVTKILFILRQKGVLPKFTEENMLEFRRRVGKEGMKVRWGNEFKSDIIHKFVLDLLAQGVDSSNISVRDVSNALLKKGIIVSSRVVTRVFNFMRKKGELEQLSQQARDRIASEVSQKGYATKERLALSNKPPVKGSKAIRIRAFVKAMLASGFELEKISHKALFGELKDKIKDLTIDDVYSVLSSLRKEKISLSLTSQPEQLRDVALDRKEKVIQILEARQRNKKIEEVVVALQKYFPKLETVGDSQVFYDILKYLLNGTKPESIILLMREKEQNLITLDVACVSQYFTLLLTKINKKEFTNLVDQTKFWEVYPFCSDIIKKSANRLNRHADDLVVRRLKALGQRL